MRSRFAVPDRCAVRGGHSDLRSPAPAHRPVAATAPAVSDRSWPAGDYPRSLWPLPGSAPSADRPATAAGYRRCW